MANSSIERLFTRIVGFFVLPLWASMFSEYVFDVWRAGWHDISDPCVDILLMINLCLHENGQDVVTTESQCVRMLRPSSASRKAIEFLGRANSRELVSKHRRERIVPTQSPKTIEGVDTTEGKPEPPVRDASCCPEWIVPPSPENKSGPPTLGIWMFDAAQCGPTTSLSAYQLSQLASIQSFPLWSCSAESFLQSAITTRWMGQ